MGLYIIGSIKKGLDIELLPYINIWYEAGSPYDKDYPSVFVIKLGWVKFEVMLIFSA